MPRAEEKAILDQVQLTDALMELPGWEVKSKQIVKTYEFKTYMDGVEFVGELARKADQLDHHPDMLLGYRKVRVATWTHKYSAVTKLDVMLAKEAEKIFEGR